MKLISSLFFEIFFNRRTDGRTDTQSESKKPRHEHDAKHGWGLINITSVCLFSFSHFQLKWGDFVHLFISLGGGGFMSGLFCPRGGDYVPHPVLHRPVFISPAARWCQCSSHFVGELLGLVA